MSETVSRNVNGDEVEIIIRSAMQTFPDRNIQCSKQWTILQLKEHLNQVLSFKPDISHQRLIYAGHCLENNRTIQSVLLSGSGMAAEDSNVTTGPAQVFHLVYSRTEALKSPRLTSSGDGLRNRANATNPTSSANSERRRLNAQPPQGTPYNYYMAQYQYQHQNYWNHMLAMQHHQMIQGNYQPSNFHLFQFPYMGAAATSFALPQIGHLFAHNAQNVPMNQFPAGGMMGVGNHLHINVAGGQAMPYFAANVPVGHNPAQLVAGANGHVHAHGNVLNGVAAHIPHNPPNPVVADAANDNGERPDILDIVYKIIRLLLLVTVVYAYSSFERFFIVLLTVSLIWFVQMQRERRNRDMLAAAAAAQQRQNLQQNNAEGAAPVAGTLPNNTNSEEDRPENPADDNNPSQGTTSDNDNNVMGNTVPVPAMNAWTLVWSTVSSFFTSLIPENPLPVE